jgi:CIC family chloride channel protein
MSPASFAIENVRAMGLFGLSVLAVSVGIVTGLGAVGFRALIALIHNAMFLGIYSFTYDANQFTPANPWGRGSSWSRLSAAWS